MQIQANGLSIEVEDSAAGDAQALARPTVVLVMGLGMQLTAWPPQFVQALVQAGYRVLRFDNRDIGLSQHLDDLGRPFMVGSYLRYRLRLPVRAPYTLQDMALDTLGVMDALGVARAHVVGVSMGAMVAQRVALQATGRVASLASVMGSSGARGLPVPRWPVLQALLARPADRSPDAVEAFYRRLYRAIGSPGFPTEEADLQAMVHAMVARSYHPEGSLRQTAAIVADTTRASALAHLRMPTLVVHGRDDPLLPLAHGEDTARRIAGASFAAVGGMGHDLAPGVVQRVLALLLPFLAAHAGALSPEPGRDNSTP